jgi:hypothetical protein
MSKSASEMGRDWEFKYHQIKDERDQLLAEKDELLEELKRLHAYAREHCLHRGLLNAGALIAKHEERK